MKNNYKKSLEDIYKLGRKHGYELALKDMELKRLQEEVKELEEKNAES